MGSVRVKGRNIPCCTGDADRACPFYDRHHGRQSADRLLKTSLADRTSLKERQADAEYELDILTNPADPRQHELIGRAGQRLLDQIGADVPDLSKAARFEEIIRRGLIELCRRGLDRYADRHDHPYYDSLFDPARPASVAALCEMIEGQMPAMR